MLLFIDSAILVGNAFITSLEKNNLRFISWDKLCEYGDKLYQFYKERGNELGLLFNKSYTNKFLENYKDWFREINLNGQSGVLLLNDVTSKMLRTEFRNQLNVDTIEAFEEIEEKFNF